MTRKTGIDEREWQAQERGRHAADADDVAAADGDVARYRVVARALRSMPVSGPPADFAAGVARLAAARREAGLDRVLPRALLGVFAVASIVVVALYGVRWWQPVHHALGGDALWLVAGTGCLAMSWAFGRLHAVQADASFTAAH